LQKAQIDGAFSMPRRSRAARQDKPRWIIQTNRVVLLLIGRVCGLAERIDGGERGDNDASL
jgi:hypothetical protein